MYTNELAAAVQTDIDAWTRLWVEQPNEFYHDRFPVCPYAQQARLAGKTGTIVYTGGGIRKFIQRNLSRLVAGRAYQQVLLVMPPRARFVPGIRQWVQDQNDWLIPADLFAMSGRAVTTQSRYPGWFNSGAYYIVGVNTLSEVLPAVDKLQAAGYYQDWSEQHYQDIVVRRQHLVDQHSKHHAG